MDLGQRIRRARLELNLSLRDVEKMTNGSVSNSYLSQIESGKITSLSLKITHQLSIALAIPLQELVDTANMPQVRKAAVTAPSIPAMLDRLEREYAEATP
jgi:transcriptional regulator with XRE-family HTH domain